MDITLRAAARLAGRVALPADKSVAHRAALFAALADGRSEITGYSDAADPQSTLSCLRALGVDLRVDGERVTVEGRGLEGLRRPDGPVDCGNSGTTMRLLAGILAGQPFDATLVGDASLSRRPMGRIADPLRLMGAGIEMTEGHAPLRIAGRGGLRAISYPLPVASAQVKSAVLLAGLYADGETEVVEREPSRDHTERMLGLPVREEDGRRVVSVRGGQRIEPRDYLVPRDFSAAAFFLVAGSIVREGELLIERVGLNPSRTALLDVLREMGADVSLRNERTAGGEPIGDLVVRPSALRGVSVGGAVIPNLIDEIPILAVAAAVAEGRTEIRDAGELRVKETDRLHAMAANLRALGAAVQERPDGLVIEGGRPLHGAAVPSFDDHRIAMAMGVAALVASGETTVLEADCARVSFPGFWEEMGKVSSGW